MRKFKVQPGTQVSGASILSTIKNLKSADMAPVVKKYGFEDVQSDQWYPLEDFHRCLHEVEQLPSASLNLVAIGMAAADYAHMPPELGVPTFPQMVEGWDEHYQANFRDGDVGHKTTVKVGPQHYKVVHENTMMPDDLEYGVMYGFAKRFLPPGTQFTVWYDEDIPRLDEGGDQTVIHVNWE
jgi:hypothetical protein